jgi:hypothetical protein
MRTLILIVLSIRRIIVFRKTPEIKTLLKLTLYLKAEPRQEKASLKLASASLEMVLIFYCRGGRGGLEQRRIETVMISRSI